MLHEICHFVAATETERRLPEFGMVPRPSLRHTAFGYMQFERYARRVPEPVVDKPGRNAREAATGYLHWNVAKVLGMGPVVPSIPRKTWLLWETRWNTKGVAWLRSQGLDPDTLVALMVAAAQAEPAQAEPMRVAA